MISRDMDFAMVQTKKMVNEKIYKPKYHDLQERLEAFYKQSIEKNYVESTQEIDVGEPVGNEQW